MIREAEIRRIAGAAGVEPRIVELDYVLGWALRGIARHESLAEQLVFKGGTCLRNPPGFRYQLWYILRGGIVPRTTVLLYKETAGAVPVKRWLEELKSTDRRGFAKCPPVRPVTP